MHSLFSVTDWAKANGLDRVYYASRVRMYNNIYRHRIRIRAPLTHSTAVVFAAVVLEPSDFSLYNNGRSQNRKSPNNIIRIIILYIT